MDFSLSITIGLLVVGLLLISGLVVYYNFRRQWFEERFQERRARQEQYRNLLYFLSEANQKMDEESNAKLIATLDSSVLVASPQIVLQLIDFQKFLSSSNLRVLKNSEYWLEEREKMTKDLLRNLRYDLYGDEVLVDEILQNWQPLTRPVRQPGTRAFEVIQFKPNRAYLEEDLKQQK